jgi:hypothetical protein
MAFIISLFLAIIIAFAILYLFWVVDQYVIDLEEIFGACLVVIGGIAVIMIMVGSLYFILNIILTPQ